MSAVSWGGLDASAPKMLINVDAFCTFVGACKGSGIPLGDFVNQWMDLSL